MKVLIAVISVILVAAILFVGISTVVIRYKLQSEVSTRDYGRVLDLQVYAPFASNKAMNDGVITYDEFYKIVDEADINVKTLAKQAIVSENVLVKAAKKSFDKYEAKEFILDSNGEIIRLEEKEGLTND